MTNQLPKDAQERLRQLPILLKPVQDHQRHVTNLVWVKRTAPPSYAKPRRLKGARAKGMTYEKLVGRFLESLTAKHSRALFSHQWFAFHDHLGTSWAQTDYYILSAKDVLLIECKLTQTDTAFLQMAQLYKPLLEMHYSLPVMTLQVCKNLRYPPVITRTAEELLLHPEYGNITWHFLG